MLPFVHARRRRLSTRKTRSACRYRNGGFRGRAGSLHLRDRDGRDGHELLLPRKHQNGFPNSYARSRARGGGDAGRRLAPTRRTGPGPVRGRARPRATPFYSYPNLIQQQNITCAVVPNHPRHRRERRRRALTSPRPRASQHRPLRARRPSEPGATPFARNRPRRAAPRAASATRASRPRLMVKRTSSRP